MLFDELEFEMFQQDEYQCTMEQKTEEVVKEAADFALSCRIVVCSSYFDIPMYFYCSYVVVNLFAVDY